MSVKRYEWVACGEHSCHCDVVESAEGDMVDYEDYAALEARCAALAAENAGLKAFGDKLYSMYKGLETSGGGFHDEQSIPYQQAAIDAAISAFEEIKTPATDASLNEFLAHGVELFAESQKEYVRKNRSELDSMTRAAYCGSAVDAERFADQLRKGVQS
ncbi:TPA: hypothetical protein ACHS9P_000494 [Enterobacter roggenkampii]